MHVAQSVMHCWALACCSSVQRSGSLPSGGVGRTNGGGGGGLMPWPTQEVVASSWQAAQLARQWSQRWVPTGKVGASQPTAAIYAAQSYFPVGSSWHAPVKSCGISGRMRLALQVWQET